ncbi:hypothetical protein N7470_007161 [Penicillium chermesinum]|nr:hypothetical protein N7470_007161 [Penicillium chermesinum]
MGTKRSWQGQPVGNEQGDMASTPAGPIMAIFESFRNELDEHHDRRERIVKVSRDITALSKKIIFALQRVRSIHEPLPPKIASENQGRFDQINDLFTSIVPEVTHINAWRYQRQVSAGLQEFIEALSFDHYLRTQKLITHAETIAHLPPGIMVTEDDYLMGLFDLTGEMMRFAVVALSSSNANANPTQSTKSQSTEDDASSTAHLSTTQAGIVLDLRAFRTECEALSIPRRVQIMRDFHKKLEVMQNSVEKVERAAYGILVRGSERPTGWTPDLSGPVEMEIH